MARHLLAVDLPDDIDPAHLAAVTSSSLTLPDVWALLGVDVEGSADDAHVATAGSAEVPATLWVSAHAPQRMGRPRGPARTLRRTAPMRRPVAGQRITLGEGQGTVVLHVAGVADAGQTVTVLCDPVLLGFGPHRVRTLARAGFLPA